MHTCRYVANVIAESTASGSGPRPFYDFLEGCLRHKVGAPILTSVRTLSATLTQRNDPFYQP